MGRFIIISAPSGTGKNAIIRELLKIFSSSTRFITTTTRDPRPGEKQSVDYHFVTKEEFEHMKNNHEFLECNLYADNWYGSEKQKLESDLKTYEFVFSTLDVNGKQSLDRLSFPHISIFLLPDTIESLDTRIRSRGGEDEENIEKRIALAHTEIEHAKDYDFALVNHEGAMFSTVHKIVDYLRGLKGD